MRRTIEFTTVTLIVAAAGPAPQLWANSAPVVSNITASQRTDGSKFVDIFYDLSDSDGDPCLVELEASSDGGLTWTIPITDLTGDFGPGVLPGNGKYIVWNSWTDLPGVVGDQFRLRICAEDSPPGGMAPIPAGEFVMGDHHDGMSSALPLHAVQCDAIYMDKFETTNHQYADALNWAFAQGNLITVIDGVVYKTSSGTTYPYCTTTLYDSYSRITWDGSVFGVVGQGLPPLDQGNKTNHPMVMVSWYGSAAYANWRSAMEGRTPSYNTTTWECDFAANGYRLPTEAEWEKAARGGNYSPYYRYPWGDSLDGSNANYDWSGDPYETGSPPWTTPVGYYDGTQIPPGVDMANGYGLYDMAANVWEWCNDWYAPGYPACVPSPCINPRGPAMGGSRVLRGGCWRNGGNQRCADRDGGNPIYLSGDNGFRLARNSS